MSLESSSLISSFEDFLAQLDVPKACELNKPIFKKMFDGKKNILSAADKKALKEDVEKIRWLYTLKPNTIHIAPYTDKEREYPEIAILHIELSRPDKFKRTSQFINRAIPYPLVLIFTCVIEGEQKLCLALADKRINQADKEKWVVEDCIHTKWISMSSVSASELKFFESIKVSSLPFTNFFDFYQALIKRVIAVKCAEYSEEFSMKRSGNPDEKMSNTARLDKLRELEKLESQRSEISKKLKNIKQMGKRIELNTQIKKITDKIASIKCNL
ncbi:TPA: DUF4391 domain-containing protein [Legionella pneumophila]|nr:DUF4391 domain-containing protein [Legionella pneumophila]